MRSFTTAILALFLTVTLNYAYAQKVQIVIDSENAVLNDVLKSISAQSDYRFVFNNRAVDVAQRITAKVSSTDINVVLGKVLSGTGIDYRIIDRQIALTPAAEKPVKAETKKERVIKGRVKDSNGEVLPGADVYVDGTVNGAVTDIDGNFTIIVPDDPETVLVFNFIGMKQEKTELGDADTFDIVMTTDTQFLKEVIVTG